MNLAPAKSRLDPQKTYVRIVQNVVLSSSQRASIWHIPSGTTVEKIMTVISPQKADELWLVASLDKNIFGHRQHGVISLKAIQENHHLIAVQEEISRHDKVL